MLAVTVSSTRQLFVHVVSEFVCGDLKVINKKDP